MEVNRLIEAQGRLVLHDWRVGKSTKEACVLELTEVSYGE